MSTSTAPYLGAADRIGRRLCRDALWAGPRCNWLGWTLRPARQSWVVAYCAQDFALYDGTAGVALFLAWLARFTGDPLQRATCLGALARVLDAAADPDPFYRLGFHSGLAGIASMLIQAAGLLEDEALAERGVALLASLGGPAEGRLDVIAGSAGVIPVLLGAAGRSGREDLVTAAMAHGEWLLGTAVRSDRGWSWDTTGQPERGHLIGYAHGAGGIACALLELARATGVDRYREAAREALRYERSFYDPSQRNWPDLRAAVVGQPPQPGPGSPRYTSAWCHGAPGVCCSRLRARQLLDDPELDGEIDAALETTAASLALATVPGQGNFCLCHGAGGCADVLLLAAVQLGRPGLRQAAEALGQAGIAHSHQTDRPWPCGTLDGREAPGLMLGLAGIGYYYLRLHAPEAVPSVLVLSPEALDAGRAVGRDDGAGPDVRRIPN